jgi:hypothetical protein
VNIGRMKYTQLDIDCISVVYLVKIKFGLILAYLGLSTHRPSHVLPRQSAVQL